MPDDRWTAAVDIGGSSTKIALVSRAGAVESLSSITTEPPLTSFLDALADHVKPLLFSHEPKLRVGVSVAGFIDDTQSSMIYNPNIPWLQAVPLRDELRSRLGCDVVLEADSNAAAVAEHRVGAGRGSRRFLCLTLGTGVGGGMIVDGAVVRLAFGGLGDIGHVIVDPCGRVCPSGCHGCAEALISAPGLEGRWGGEPRTAREIIEFAKTGHPDAAALMRETGRLLGVAVASCTVVLFPDTIAIAGGIAEAGELLIEPARFAVDFLTGPFYRRNLRIEKAVLGWKASLVGAGLLGMGDDRIMDGVGGDCDDA